LAFFEIMMQEKATKDAQKIKADNKGACLMGGKEVCFFDFCQL